MSSEVVALGFSFTVNLPGERNLVFQTHVPQSASAAEVNSQLDKVLAVADRAVAKYTLPLLRKQFEVESGQRDRCADDLKRIDDLEAARAVEWAASNRRGPYKPDKANQQAQREAAATTLKALNKKLDQLKTELVACEDKANGVDQRANN